MDGSTMMTFDQFMALRKQMEEAQTDETPYLAVTPDDELHVIGNPNKTEHKSADYTVYFIFPDTELFRKRAKASGYTETNEMNGEPLKSKVPSGYFLCKGEYNGVFISPRNIGNVVTAFTLVERFFYDVTDDGDVKDLSYEQAMQVFNSMNHEVSDATYEIVSAVLGIPIYDVEWMLPINVMENAVRIVAQNPDVVNGADLFFGLSSNSES